jgi:PAS domain S-box-containing protein
VVSLVEWSAEFFRSALDHIPDAVLISDGDGAVRFANRQVPALFGYSADEILGHGVERLVPEQLRQKHAEERLRVTAAEVDRPMGSRPSFAARHKDGSDIPVQVSLATIRGADGVFVVAAIRGYAAHLELSRELCRARAAAACAERSARNAQEALASQRQSQDARLAAMSYSLRQQLQALSLLGGLMSRGRKLDDTMLRNAVSSQSKVITTMTSLLDALPLETGLSGVTMATAPECPVADSTSEPQSPRSTPVRDPVVLVVLADGGTREATCGLLRLNGYETLIASNLAQAQEIARFRPDIGLLLTEQSLQGAEAGREIIASLCRILGSGLKAVLLSHDALVPAAAPIGSEGAVRFARMPIPAEELLRMLAELRDERTPLATRE